MNCKNCRLNKICKDKKDREKRDCDNWVPEEWGVAKRRYEKELQRTGEKLNA